ncbi:1-phosphofructokinase [Halobellus limi]|uniref:1-phosphofructokinase n=1 Tax=Halobellus limi TaxID=699433 RepID=A0A1H5ULS6_9EURY|nr:1-phosphofructokinase [Halobellus limi]QCC46993.1 1-phosphofructokinase [Halobellus limi]SEF75974.1 1-phosphofructokinase [Halobellus limi]
MTRGTGAGTGIPAHADVLTVTMNPAVDHTLTVEEPLREGAVARTDDAQFDAGGKGINVSQYLTALGVEAPATGFLGGPFGRMIADALDDDGVARDFVEIDGRTRLNTTVLSPDGEYKINHNGPVVDGADVDALVERVRDRDPDRLVVAGSLPRGIGADTVDRLAEAGPWETAVDMGGAFLDRFDGSYLVCKPNRAELAEATGREIETLEDAASAAAELRERGYRYVLASLGADGALLVSDSGAVHARALPVDVVDTVGAGDAMLSGFLAGLARGESTEDALRTAVVVAARVVSVSGTSVPAFDDVFASRERVTVARV